MSRIKNPRTVTTTATQAGTVMVISTAQVNPNRVRQGRRQAPWSPWA